MNTPSYNVLLNKEKLIKTVQDLCNNINEVQETTSIFKVGNNNALYIIGVGGFDGTNEDDPEVKSLQEVLEG